MAMRSVVCWTLLGVALIDKMKGILGHACTFGPKAYNTRLPVSLDVVHMACSSCVSFIFVKPLTSPPISCRLYLSFVVPVAALYSLSLCSFSASIYLLVSVMRMIKAFTPVKVHSIFILFKSEITRASPMAPYIIMIVVSIIIVACGKTKLNARAHLTATLVSETTRAILIQVLLTSKGVSLHLFGCEALLLCAMFSRLPSPSLAPP